MALLQKQFERKRYRESGLWASLVLFFLIGIPSQVWAKMPLCSQVFADPSYFREVIETRGLRLFIKNSVERTETKWFGVVRHVPQTELANSFKLANGLRYAIKTLPLKLFKVETEAPQGGRFELTPTKALYDQTVLRASNNLSKKFFNKNLEPAFFSRLPFAIFFGVMVWNQIDDYYAEQLQTHMDENIKQNAAIYERLLMTDYRYRGIKKDFLKGKISHEDALKGAFWVEFAYSEYFKYRDANPEALSSLDSSMVLLKHLAFNHLQKIFSEGVNPAKGFEIPKEHLGPISNDQKLQLFKINHVLNFQYQLLYEYLGKTEAYQRLKDDPEVRRLLDLSLKNAFAEKLLAMHAAGLITDDSLLTSLQEDASWRARFAEWSTIGVVKLKVDDEGKQTNVALKIEDIRVEILQEISQRH